MFIDKARLIAVEQMPAAAVAQPVFMVRHEHVQHLSRADAIEQLHAKLFFPLFTKMRGQRFTGRDAESQAGAVKLTARAMMFEQQVVDHGHRKKDRRTMLGEVPRDDVWRRLLATQYR